MHVEIPFRDDMAFAVVSGRKVCTTRNEKYGNVDDTFDVVNGGIRAHCAFTNVEQRRLGFVAMFLHVAEGFDAVRDFIDVWDALHPKKKFVEYQMSKKWVHWFEVVSYHTVEKGASE